MLPWWGRSLLKPSPDPSCNILLERSWSFTTKSIWCPFSNLDQKYIWCHQISYTIGLYPLTIRGLVASLGHFLFFFSNVTYHWKAYCLHSCFLLWNSCIGMKLGPDLSPLSLLMIKFPAKWLLSFGITVFKFIYASIKKRIQEYLILEFENWFLLLSLLFYVKVNIYSRIAFH